MKDKMSFNEYYDNYLVRYVGLITKSKDVGRINYNKFIQHSETLLRWYDVWGEIS